MTEQEGPQTDSTISTESESTGNEAAIQESPQTAHNAELSEELAGVALLVIGYTQENGADETLKMLQQAKKDGAFNFEDAAVVRQDAKGKVHIHETEDMSTGKGAGIGAVVGGLLGLLGGPAGVALGAGVGAGLGGALAHHDAGFRKEGLEDVGAALRPGTSALVVTTSKYFVEQIRKEVPAADLADVSRRISQEIADSLAAGKDMAFALLLTEVGIAVREIRVDDETAEIYGLVITEEGVAAGAAVISEEGAAFEGAASTADGDAYVAGIVTGEGAVVDSAVATGDEVVEEVAVFLPEDDATPEADAEAANNDAEAKDKPV